MSDSGTLLIDALLERMSPAEARALLEKLDKSIEQSVDQFRRPAPTGNARRRKDNRASDIPGDMTTYTPKDS